MMKKIKQQNIVSFFYLVVASASGPVRKLTTSPWTVRPRIVWSVSWLVCKLAVHELVFEWAIGGTGLPHWKNEHRLIKIPMQNMTLRDWAVIILLCDEIIITIMDHDNNLWFSEVGQLFSSACAGMICHYLECITITYYDDSGIVEYFGADK